MPLQNFVKLYYKSGRPRVVISASLLLVIAAAILIVPIQWIAAWLLALFVHELFHYMALKVCGTVVSSVRLSINGIVMDTQQLSYGREAVCAYAGPLGALILVLFAKYMPRTSICTIILSAYNLLPLFPLDGGRGMACLLKIILPERSAGKVMFCIENGVLALIVVLMCYAVLKLNLGVFPAFVTITILSRSKRINIPCKKRRLGLQ